MNINCVNPKAKAARRVLSGICMSITGATVWAVLCLVGPELLLGPSLTLRKLHEAAVVVGYAVSITVWFVAPIGGLIGFFLPPRVEGLSRQNAFWLGVRVGAAAGLLVAVILAVASAFPSIRKGFHFTWILGKTMVPVCALWVGIWILHWTREPKCQAVIRAGDPL